ncbi:MAG: hypothetical protein WCG10_03860 [Chlamydiota bacterium]
MSRVGYLIYGILVIACSSCGYRFSQHSSQSITCVSVPYIKGDIDGRLTSKVIQVLSTSSKWRYTQGNADLILEAEILKNQSDYIGYQYDHLESGALIDRLVPSEGRKKVLVKLQIVNSHTRQVLYGPYEIEGNADYDFVNSDTYTDLAFVDSLGKTYAVLPFSLGQLDAQQGAIDAALDGAYQQIAEKILVGLQNL